MTALSLLLALCVPCDDREDLGKAARKAAEMSSYAFKLETKVDAAAGNIPAGQVPEMDGKYQKDSGLYVRVGDRAEVFRKDGKTYVKAGENDWQDAEAARAAGQGQGRRALMGRMLRGMKTPHEEVAGLEKSFKDVKKVEAPDKVGEAECAVYAGDLSDEALKDSPIGKMLGQFAAQVEVTGKGKAWVDKGGNVVRYQISTKISGDFQGNSFDVTMLRTIDFSGVGETKVEVPEAVKKLASTPSVDKKEEPKKEPEK
jgi:hypothetical protein